MRRVAVPMVFALALLFSGAPPVGAETPALPVVRVSGTTPMGLTYECFVAEPTTTPGSFTFERDTSTDPLTVTYHISGGPTDLNSDPAGEDHTVTFAAGDASVTVTVHPALGGGSASVSIVPTSGYTVGTPSSGTVDADITTPTCPSNESVEEPASRSQALPRTGTFAAPLVLLGLAVLVLGIGLQRLSAARIGS